MRGITNSALRYYSTCTSPRLMSKILRTTESLPKENLETSTTSKSFKLMLKHGLISSSSPGIYNLMPMALISFEKLCKIIDRLMTSIGGQKCLLPTLTQSSLWKTSGRWGNQNVQLFKLLDRHSTEYCLGPTHEEAVTSMLSNYPLSLKTLPLRVYQISTKFRDEINPRLGLLRSREFIMKDMYTFDTTTDNAKVTYNDVCDSYNKLFDVLDVPFVKVEGSSAGMGGDVSQEYHFLSNVGEDDLLLCSNCGKSVNAEVLGESTACSECGSQMDRKRGIEVGHAFLLGTTYTEPFSAKFKTKDGKENLLHMGCYGLGVTRILAASIECLSDADNIRWPNAIAPFVVSIIPPKKGSKEEKVAGPILDFMIKSLCSIEGLSNNVVLDDRTNFSIGKRVQDSNSLGIPYAVVISGSALEDVPRMELIENYSQCKKICSHYEIMSFFRDCNIQQ